MSADAARDGQARGTSPDQARENEEIAKALKQSRAEFLKHQGQLFRQFRGQDAIQRVSASAVQAGPPGGAAYAFPGGLS